MLKSRRRHTRRGLPPADPRGLSKWPFYERWAHRMGACFSTLGARSSPTIGRHSGQGRVGDRDSWSRQTDNERDQPGCWPDMLGAKRVALSDS